MRQTEQVLLEIVSWKYQSPSGAKFQVDPNFLL